MTPRRTPTIIHRTSIGCYERTLALLIEKYAGAFPAWLAPVQVKVLPISDKYMEYGMQVKETLEKYGIRVEIDTRKEKIGYKIREARLEKVPYMLIVGEKEQEENAVSVRDRKEGDIGSLKLDDFVKLILEKVSSKAKD